MEEEQGSKKVGQKKKKIPSTHRANLKLSIRTPNKGIAAVWKALFALNHLSSHRAFEYKRESLVCNQRSSSAISGLQGRGGEGCHNYISPLCALSSVNAACKMRGKHCQARRRPIVNCAGTKRALNHRQFSVEADVSQTFSASVQINPTF